MHVHNRTHIHTWLLRCRCKCRARSSCARGCCSHWCVSSSAADRRRRGSFWKLFFLGLGGWVGGWYVCIIYAAAEVNHHSTRGTAD